MHSFFFFPAQGQGSEIPSFMGNEPFCFQALLPAADADWVQNFMVSPLRLEAKSIPNYGGPFEQNELRS